MNHKRVFERLIGVVAALGVLSILACCTCSKEPEGNVAGVQDDGKAGVLVIETKHGTVECELYPQDAPKTVARIKELAQSGFYNGLVFHRVVPGFVVQGGDPSGNGTGGSGTKLPAEFNSRQHQEGTLAMARAADINSADSQFYISLGRHPHLDNNYTVFGQCLKGMEAVKSIKQGDKMDKVYVR